MDPYVQQLLDAIAIVIEDWLERCVVRTATRFTGQCTPELHDSARVMAQQRSSAVLDQLELLLATDVDRQRTNPLSILRDAVRYPTELLDQAGIPRPRRDDFAIRAFPNDAYDLSPATWADVDHSLQEPGLIWGAWKAKTVLDRRRTIE